MAYLFTSESVSEGHPDKVSDQISDALIDNFMAFDPSSKVACETLVTTGQVVLAGEVKSTVYLDVQKIARKPFVKLATLNLNICLMPIPVVFFLPYMSNLQISIRAWSAVIQKTKVQAIKE